MKSSRRPRKRNDAANRLAPARRTFVDRQRQRGWGRAVIAWIASFVPEDLAPFGYEDETGFHFGQGQG